MTALHEYIFDPHFQSGHICILDHGPHLLLLPRSVLSA